MNIEFRNENLNSAKNFNSVSIGDITLYFSYETIVAFRTPKTGMVASENVWGNTTGKHLNWISDKSQRIPRQDFLDMVEKFSFNINIEN